MTMTRQPETITAWRYYVSADYTLPDVRGDVAALLAGWDAITEQTDKLQRSHADATGTHAELRQHAGSQLAAGVVAGKGKPNAADLAKRLSQHLDARGELELQLQVTRQAAAVITGQLLTLLSTHAEHLVRWVAQHRETVGLTMCGSVMPQPVKLMHALLDVQLDPRWDAQLTLPRTPTTSTRHLPLEWAATDPVQQRASLAWVWQQLAAGNVQRVNVPARAYPGMAVTNPPRSALRLVYAVEALPSVPVMRERGKPVPVV